MNITIVTTADKDEQARELLALLVCVQELSAAGTELAIKEETLAKNQ